MIRLNRSPELLSMSFFRYSGSSIPSSYLSNGRSFLFMRGSVILGGFAIIDNSPFRTISQIPIDISSNIAKNEITAYFIADKKYGVIITAKLIIEVLKSKGPFVYSYDVSNIKLEKYYMVGRPYRVYSGMVNNLQGMSGIHFENVEILTKRGILRLFTNRTMKGFKLWLSSLLEKTIQLKSNH